MIGKQVLHSGFVQRRNTEELGRGEECKMKRWLADCMRVRSIYSRTSSDKTANC